MRTLPILTKLDTNLISGQNWNSNLSAIRLEILVINIYFRGGGGVWGGTYRKILMFNLIKGKVPRILGFFKELFKSCKVER